MTTAAGNLWKKVFKLALCQFKVVGDKAANIKEARAFIEVF